MMTMANTNECNAEVIITAEMKGSAFGKCSFNSITMTSFSKLVAIELNAAQIT